MSEEKESTESPYCQVYVNAWTILCALVAGGVFLMFVFGTQILNTGHWIWDLLRYLAKPVI